MLSRTPLPRVILADYLRSSGTRIRLETLLSLLPDAQVESGEDQGVHLAADRRKGNLAGATPKAETGSRTHNP